MCLPTCKTMALLASHKHGEMTPVTAVLEWKEQAL